MSKNILLLGGICIDKYYMINNYPDRGYDTVIKSSFEVVGGCPLNVAKTLKNLDMNPIIFSSISDDCSGETIYSYIVNEAYDTKCLVKLKNEKTGYCMVFIDEQGERTFMTYNGCEGYFDESIICDEIINSINYIYITGIYLVHKYNNDSICNFLKAMTNLGKKVIFDPGPLINELDVLTLSSILELSYIVKVNTVELNTISKILNISGNILPNHWINTEYVIETQGSNGCYLHTKNNLIHFLAFPCNVVDTNGSGDSFVGGLIYGLCNYNDINYIIKIASACGALTAETLGAHRQFNLSTVIDKIKNN